MYAIDSVVLYVEDIAVSKRFYTELLERSPQELSPTFISFELESDLKLELKERAKAQPPATITGGGTELSIRVPDETSLNRLFEQWKSRGIGFAQTPTTLVFGLTFVALDPDGHRLRIFA
jgi:catechol-2,3-dioxygenase